MNEILKQNKTAFYVFDVKTLKDRVAYLRKMLPEDVAICYAIKANTFITAELGNDVDRFEICSPGEAEICDLLDIPDKNDGDFGCVQNSRSYGKYGCKRKMRQNIHRRVTYTV